MATVLAGIVFIAIGIILIPIVWTALDFSPTKYKRLKDLEIQRRNLARQIAEEAHEADWLTRFFFKRFLRKGGNHL